MKRNLFKTAVFLSWALLLAGHSYAQDDEDTLRITLQQAQDHAMEHNVQVRNSEIDIKIADKEVWETTARGLPQISASGSYNNNLSLSTQLFPNFIEPTILQVLMEQGVIQQQPVPEPEKIEVQFGSQHTFDGSLSVSQLIFSGPYIVGLQAARVYKGLFQQRHQQSKQEIKANVARTYHSILLTRRNVDILKDNLASLKQSMKDSRALYENGMVEQTEVEKIQISVSSLENSINTTQRQFEKFQNLLKIQLGLELERPLKLTQSLEEIVMETTINESIQEDFDVTENVNYQLMDTQVQLSELDLKREKAQFLPTLSGFYNFRENAMRDKFNPLDPDEKWYESSMFGFELSVPIFNSGQKISRVQQAKLNLKKSENNLSDTRKNLINNYIQAENNYKTAYEKMRNSQENMELAKKVYNRVSKKFSEGMASSMELTQANRDYLNTESNYINAVVDLLNAKTELEKIRNEL
ncbi:MAG: TolC family protein [Bacteroidales bacterium]